MSHTKNRSDTPRFQVGDKVRVYEFNARSGCLIGGRGGG